MADDPYTGDETAVELQPLPLIEEPGIAFGIPPPNIPEKVRPIFDEEIGVVIGYRSPGSVWRVYDLEGKIVGIEELPVEPSLFSPLDLIGGFGGKFFFQSATRRIAAGVAGRVAVKGIGSAVAATLRKAIAKLITGAPLRFTATTASHMATKGRHVPVHILQLAIRYGQKAADPQRVKGAVQYTIKMMKYAGGTPGKPIYKEYTLEVVIREADRTVLHFLYK